ncbi:AMP-binding protein [Pseudonocardia lacus]|uniref:AMP-binding protein n=1 Tax=Pseudonocardia lacus TaxID=2835865 RepID=UPI001BDC948B|nr:AMP-binding protein [Pseudonocardia lacus]
MDTAHHLTRDRLHPFGGTDVWQLLLTRARTHAGRPFVVWQPFDAGPVTTTFDELAAEAAAVAAGLAARGVRTGDRVLVHLENSPEFVVSWFACAALGAVAVTTNSRSSVDEMAYFAQDSAAVGVITQPRFVDVVAAAAPGLGFAVSTGNDSGVPSDAGGAAEPFAALRGDPDALPARPTDPLAPCSVQYTSGTTSRPKGVLWTQANALWGARVNAAHETLRRDDRHLVYLPLFHTNALAYSMLASLWVGAAFVLVPKWSTSRFADIVVRHGCTWMSLVGLSTRALVESEPPAGHALRHFGAGVCDLPIDALYGVKTIGWWGMTETISHPVVGDAFVPNRPMSMGRPSTDYEVKVVRPDGELVEPDETGELKVRGVRGLSLFAEYLNREADTAAAFDAEGWFATGDLVTPHPDGHLTFENRSKDMLKVGAENVSAAEVERVILGVPGVLEAGVVARPDAKLDEVPVAFVTTATDDPGVLAGVEAACTDLLADFKRPRAVYRVSQLPRSTLAKINKVELRAVATPDADREGAQKRWIDAALADPSGNAG